MTNSSIVEALAADLAGARVDPNEAQKALAYLRGKRDPKRFFDYLQAVVNNGQVVIRSRQTLDYYRALQQICQRHLRGMAYQEMAETLGWAIRLLRYYRVVPEAVQRQERSAPQPSPRREEAPPPARRDLPAKTEDPAAAAKGAEVAGAPAERAYPNAFTGDVIDGDEEIFIIRVPGFPESEVIAVLRNEPGGPKFRVGKDKAKVEVVNKRQAKDGRITLEVRRPPKDSSRGA